MSWDRATFVEALQDVSAGNTKIAQSEFRSSGALAIVDQGRSLVAGYTDDADAAVKAESPLIVFGDHTRAIKFVDFPFAMGADGVKVLLARGGFDPKFVYWYLRSCDIPSAGYSRHFKFLKGIEVPRPPLPEQRRIAAILDQADSLRAKRRQSLAHLDALAQSIFRDMFGGGCFAPVKAGQFMPSMRNGLSPASSGTYPADVLTLSAITHGLFDPTAVKPGLFACEPPADKRVTAHDFMMCRGNGNKALVGVGAFSAEDRPDLVFPDTVIAGRIDPDLITMPFLQAAWKEASVRMQIETVARTTNGTYKVNQRTLSEVAVALPPLTLQREFGARIGRVNARVDALKRALTLDDELFVSLQSRAFRGEL